MKKEKLKNKKDYWLISQGIAETLFLIFIYLGSLYKFNSLNYLQITAEVFFILLFAVLITGYKIIAFFHPNIKLYSQDNLNLIRMAVYFMFIVFLLPLPMEIISALNKTMISAGPVPQTSLEWLGYAVSFPAITATVFYPMLKFIALVKKPTKKVKISFFLTIIALIFHIFLRNKLIIVGGYTLSALTAKLKIN
jgi:hypothetical protein